MWLTVGTNFKEDHLPSSDNVDQWLQLFSFFFQIIQTPGLWESDSKGNRGVSMTGGGQSGGEGCSGYCSVLWCRCPPDGFHLLCWRSCSDVSWVPTGFFFIQLRQTQLHNQKLDVAREYGSTVMCWDVVKIHLFFIYGFADKQNFNRWIFTDE